MGDVQQFAAVDQALLLRVLAAEVRAQTPPSDEDYAATVALVEMFEAGADVLARTDRRDRSSEVNALLWKVLILAKLLVVAFSPSDDREWDEQHGIRHG